MLTGKIQHLARCRVGFSGLIVANVLSLNNSRVLKAVIVKSSDNYELVN